MKKCPGFNENFLPIKKFSSQFNKKFRENFLNFFVAENVLEVTPFFWFLIRRGGAPL